MVGQPGGKGGDAHQSVFPPDVTAVFDHGKRDVSAFPIATGTYYKVDYSAGVDISRYKTFLYPPRIWRRNRTTILSALITTTSAVGYCMSPTTTFRRAKTVELGLWRLWRAWDRNLTDENGPYIELMTGVYTDNQPDFTACAL